jgi:hypothetical protein
LLALIMAGVLPLVGSAQIKAAEGTAQVAGTWAVTFEGRNGSLTQTLTLQQDGGRIKGTLEGRRGPAPLEGTVRGNKISFTVKREFRDRAVTLEYTGTVEQDVMKGTVHGGRFDREWTATRTGETGKK